MNRTAALLAAICLLTACASHELDVMRSFDGPNISRVILRASRAFDATEVNLPATSPAISIRGTPYLRVGDRHDMPAFLPRHLSLFRARPDFVARQFGDTLVISTKNEVSYPDCDYYMNAIHLWIALPTNIHIIREVHPVAADGSADLSPPVSSKP
jgi:hypothetical protein